MNVNEIEFKGSRILEFTNGRSLNQIALAAGITRQFLTDIVKGRSKPSSDVALRLASVLGCSVHQLSNEKNLRNVSAIA